ncbi:MAG: hypothetical protein ACP5JQ_07840, partial [Caldimicrobium sp.]
MLKEGCIIKGAFFSEPVKVEKVVDLGDYIHIIGSTTNSKSSINRVLKREELSSLEVIEPTIDFSANPQNTFFVIEAMRFKFASLFDPLLAMNVSK